MNDYQAYGSGITYYRRYALSSMLGLVTDKDTDAAGEVVVDPLIAEWTTLISGIADLEDLRKIYKENTALRATNKAIESLFRDRKRVLENLAR
jgi:hypothetical protein